MITVREARDEAEVRRAADTCWPGIEAGQAGFSLAGLASREALTERWLELVGHETDCLLLAEDDGELVGACGLFVPDPTSLQTMNGPVALRDHAAVYDALLEEIRGRHPGAQLSVGVSHRHERAIAWLRERGAVLNEHSWPYTGTAVAAPMPPGVHLVGPEADDRFVELYDRLVGQDLWWTAERIVAAQDSWIRLVGDGWASVLAARVYPASTMSEVFATAAPDVETCATLLAAWLGEAARRDRPDAVFFAESEQERDAAARVGMTCSDEYLAYLVTC